MSKPDKATTERNSKILRELVKQPDNKVCADCKRNDPRWASWNLGVFLCIRCSGIHRGMGTHISRVKSIDLDMWTPEQMESVQKWGNRRANLYWEAHLKAGHVPPDHKMESFVRSKYESRRWAMDDPPPSDPSVLDGASSNGDAAVSAAPLVGQSSRSTHAPTASLSAPRAASPSLHTSGTPRHQQSQSRQLLSATVAGRANLTLASPAQPQSQPQFQSQQQQEQPADDLFSLDFHAPSVSKSGTAAPLPPAKDVKQDILSLFSSAPATMSTAISDHSSNAHANAFGQFASAQPSWDAFGPSSTIQSQTQPQPQPTSMMGTGGTGLWGVSSGWNATPTASTASSNIWGNSTTISTSTHQPNTFNTADIWGGSSAMASTTTNNLFASQTPAAAKKDDVFGDLWGDFK
ncbi:ArfGap-domain-containing protein [Gyrodon lividus]|nr:ArfGap-domain-containing protein [Gyrodon lividus]